MARRNLAEISALVHANNKSLLVSDNLLICLIWKESGFDDAARNSSSTATGLMQVTKDAVGDVNKSTPKGVHFRWTT